MPTSDDERFLKRLSDSRTSREALGMLLDSARKYLLSVADDDIADDLRVKIAASDVVQDTLMEAVRDFSCFDGTTEAEFFGWLRQILRNNLYNWNRWYRSSSKRSILMEVPANGFGASHSVLGELASDEGTPSGIARAAEQCEKLEEAMESLSDEYRQVIRLRNWELLTFEQIGHLMGRSPDASRMLWGRAIDRLSHSMGNSVDF